MSRYNPRGYRQEASLDAAAPLPDIPAGAGIAVIRVSEHAVRIRDDGVDPTASVGWPIDAGDTYTYEGDLSALKVIEQTSGAVIDVLYYS